MKLEESIKNLQEGKSDENSTFVWYLDKSWQKKAAKSLNNELKKIIGVDPKIKISSGANAPRFEVTISHNAKLKIKSADIVSSMKLKMYKNLWVTTNSKRDRDRYFSGAYFDADNNVIDVSVRYTYNPFNGLQEHGTDIGTFTIDSSGKITKMELEYGFR